MRSPTPPAAVSDLGRLAYLDRLRAISIVAVVVLHAAAWNWSTFDPSGSAWQTLNWADSAVRFSVPVFFMISGSLFLDPKRNVTWRSLFRKSLPRLLVAFVVWSVFFALVGTYGPGGTGTLVSLATQIVLGHYHLWFLFALVGLYLVTPILRRVVTDRTTAWYFVGLAGVFASVLPLLTHVPLAGKLLQTVLDTMQLQLVLGYTLYFVLGYLLSTARVSPKQLRWAFALGAAGIVVTAVGTSWLTQRGNEPNGLLYDYLTPGVVLSAVAVFLGVKAWSESRPQARPGHVVSTLSTYSFGIFLVHPLFQWGYQQFGITTAFAHPVSSVPLLALMILVPSLLVAMLLRRMPRLGRFIA
ncbi:acyltransferase [Leucobacter sp. M11]|uniref:acyltransferase n=1 Tax=Leucobacter sp. M11 TaxID=2993565 RepID=UPI002D7EFEF0|nr:acyltransferase family protein [Leucobacter sp. M11]MEB4615426.1 acyltransferase family protein [Leucobacter sp. M11]